MLLLYLDVKKQRSRLESHLNPLVFIKKAARNKLVLWTQTVFLVNRLFASPFGMRLMPVRIPL
jgi:hypothetical protein